MAVRPFAVVLCLFLMAGCFGGKSPDTVTTPTTLPDTSGEGPNPTLPTTPTHVTPTPTVPTPTVPTTPTPKPPTPTPPTPVHNHGNGTGGGTGGDDEDENTAPVADLTASVLQGLAPLLVNFTIHGTDAEDDDMTFSLDTDGDGDWDINGTVPMVVSLNFTAGLYNVTLRVFDGELYGNETLQVNAILAIVPQDAIAFNGTAQGLFGNNVVGHNFTVVQPGDEWMNVTFAYDDPLMLNDLDLRLIDPDGNVTESGEIGEEPMLSFPEPKAGLWRVEVVPVRALAGLDYTIDIEFE